MPNKNFLTENSTVRNIKADKKYCNKRFLQAIKTFGLPEKLAYSFKLNNTLIKIVFAAETTAPTIEDALVKIATRKTD